MKEEKEIKGYYGSGNTPCIIFYYDGWYCVEGSVNVNRTYEELNLGVNVETLDDYDCITSCNPIESLEDLKALIDED